MLDNLNEFIRSNPDPRELKRALAVQDEYGVVFDSKQSYYTMF